MATGANESSTMISLADLKHVTLSVTNRCNLSCVWCFNGSTRDGDQPLSTDDLSRIIESAAGVAESMTLTGGEPFVRKDILTLIELAARRFRRIGVTTNGLAITPRLASALVDCGVVVSTSVDGDEEHHDAIRGNGTYSRTIGNIRMLTDRGVPVVIAMTVSKRNLSAVDSLIALAERLGVVGVSFQRFRCIGNGATLRQERLSADELETLAYRLQRARASCKTLLIEFKDPLRTVVDAETQPHFSSVPSNCVWGGCRAGMGFLFIAHDGAIQPCPFLPFNLGNALKADLEDIWLDSEVLRALRTQSCYQRCGGCAYWQGCRGCRADAYADTGSYLAPDPLCWVEMKNKETGERSHDSEGRETGDSSRKKENPPGGRHRRDRFACQHP